MKKKTKLDAKKVVRKLARERIGTVPATRPIEPKSRKQPRHKKDPREENGF
jgi:hypothetical protein